MGHSSKNLITVVLLLLAIAVSSGCETEQIGRLDEGQAFPMAALNGLKAPDDKVIDYNNKTLVINFWASWCPPCRKEMPDLQQLSDAMDPSQFLIIGISVDDDINLMKEFLLQNHIRFANYQDKDQSLSRNRLGIRSYPETFIISPQGTIIKRILGEQRWNSKAVQALLHSIHTGNKPRPGGWAFG